MVLPSWFLPFPLLRVLGAAARTSFGVYSVGPFAHGADRGLSPWRGRSAGRWLVGGLGFNIQFLLATFFISRLRWYLGPYFQDTFVEYRRFVFFPLPLGFRNKGQRNSVAAVQIFGASSGLLRSRRRLHLLVSPQKCPL